MHNYSPRKETYNNTSSISTNISSMHHVWSWQPNNKQQQQHAPRMVLGGLTSNSSSMHHMWCWGLAIINSSVRH